jgi:hypothetical protein
MKTILRTAIAAAVALGCVSAQAELVKFHVKGTINYSNGTFADVPVGTPVIGAFTYDTEAEPDYTYESDEYDVASYPIDPKYSFNLKFGGHVLKAVNVRAQVTDGVPDIQLDVFDLAANPGARLDGAVCEGCFFSITLVASPDHANALDSVELPSSLKLKRFDREHYGYVIVDHAQGPALQFSVDSIRRAP